MRIRIFSIGISLLLLVSCDSGKNDSNLVRSTPANCNAEITGSIRSEPSIQAGKSTVLGSGGTLLVTGVKTEGNWVQIKRVNGNAWVYSDKISNFSQLQSQGCFSQTVSDAKYIKSTPKIKNVGSSSKIASENKKTKPLDKRYKSYDECFASLQKTETHDNAQNQCAEAFYPEKSEVKTKKEENKEEVQKCQELIDRGISDRNIERCDKIKKSSQELDGKNRKQEKAYYKEKYGGDLEACAINVENEYKNIGTDYAEARYLCKKPQSKWGPLN
jgi:uncharacterized protein YraI